MYGRLLLLRSPQGFDLGNETEEGGGEGRVRVEVGKYLLRAKRKGEEQGRRAGEINMSSCQYTAGKGVRILALFRR